MDTIREGIALAEEAVRDIVRETSCSRARAADVAEDGLAQWHRGVISAEDWPAVIEAARSHLSSIMRGDK